MNLDTEITQEAVGAFMVVEPSTENHEPFWIKLQSLAVHDRHCPTALKSLINDDSDEIKVLTINDALDISAYIQYMKVLSPVSLSVAYKLRS